MVGTGGRWRTENPAEVFHLTGDFSQRLLKLFFESVFLYIVSFSIIIPVLKMRNPDLRGLRDVLEVSQLLRAGTPISTQVGEGKSSPLDRWGAWGSRAERAGLRSCSHRGGPRSAIQELWGPGQGRRWAEVYSCVLSMKSQVRPG